MVSICCKRTIGFIIFLIFGVINVGVSIEISNETNHDGPKTISFIMYGILLFTSIRYKQMIPDCPRFMSALVIFIGYCVYFGLTIHYLKETGNQLLYIALLTSIITAICDVGVFTSYFYTENGREYTMLDSGV